MSLRLHEVAVAIEAHEQNWYKDLNHYLNFLFDHICVEPGKEHPQRYAGYGIDRHHHDILSPCKC